MKLFTTSTQMDRLTSTERDAIQRAFDELVPKLPGRPRSEVDAELAEIRRARRAAADRERKRSR